MKITMNRDIVDDLYDLLLDRTQVCLSRAALSTGHRRGDFKKAAEVLVIEGKAKLVQAEDDDPVYEIHY